MRISFDLMSPSFLSWDTGRHTGGSIRNGYRRVRYGGKWLNHHILIWEHFNGAVPEGMEVDHIDRNKLNNAPSNLRLVTRSENNRNRSVHRNNKSGIKGVYWHKHRQVWYGQCRRGNKTFITAGCSTKEQAAELLEKLKEEINYDDFQNRPV